MDWDQETYLPPGGVEDRANQLATLGGFTHQVFTSDRLAGLLERAERELDGAPEDSFEASLVRVTRRDYEQALRLPAALVEDLARAGAEARPDWLAARERGDWSIFKPRLERNVELSQAVADCHGFEGSRYDALIERGEPGLSTRRVEELFEQLKQAVVPMLAAIQERSDHIQDGVLDRDYDPARQIQVSLAVIRELGYDFRRGRLDISQHPFSVAFGPGDVRITTRVKRNVRDSCLFSCIHESGHAMYDQGVPRDLDRTPLWGGASSGVHESQSRFWENLVGRSRPFWRHFFPLMRDAFPAQLADQDAESFYRANNRVRPTYIRVDADEVTYNLHVLLRFEIERDLVEGRIGAGEVPEAWNELLGRYLGLPPPDLVSGPLQDIHWVSAPLGTFVGYTLGNLISAQLMDRARLELGDVDALLEAGDFSPLLAWLRSAVHQHGRKFTPDELTLRATGAGIGTESWISYARAKFGELYDLSW